MMSYAQLCFKIYVFCLDIKISIYFLPSTLSYIFRTIPERNKDCNNGDCDTDKSYGMHEDNLHYLNCKLRKRNEGLFTADQVSKF